MVAGDDVALFINAKTSVSVTVIGKTYVQMILNDILLQSFNVSRAAVGIDVEAIRSIVDDKGLSS